MSLYDAMMIGVSGLNSSSRAMSIFSSNIANVNTVGYKASTSQFQTMLGSVYADGSNDAGVIAQAQANITQQGAEFQTQSPTDLAISGNGFFAVNSSADGAGQMLYTRAGSFLPDSNGDLKNSAGLYLQGWPLNSDGSVASTALSPINLNGLSGKGQATSTMSLDANLNAEADITTPYNPGDMFNGTVTPQFQTTMNVYDSQGGSQPVQISYVKTDANTWQYEMSYTGDPSNVTKNPLATGTLTFDTNGALSSIASTDGGASVVDANNPGSLDITMPWSATSGLMTTPNQAITFAMGTIGKTDGMSQTANASSVASSHVDGAVYGTVTGETIGADGTVYANYSNGLTQAAFKIPVATFANPDALQQVGGNAFQTSNNSGNPVLNAAGAGSSGSIQSYALEGSTVDLATEFTNMITTQQAYSASARVITTASQMLDTLMQLQH